MTQPHVLELAKQGDPDAIATLMNQSLQPRGMTALVDRQGDLLEVVLEAERVPNRDALTAFVQKGIDNLGIESIRSIRIVGQQTGATFPAWMQELSLATDLFSDPGIASIDTAPPIDLESELTAGLPADLSDSADPEVQSLDMLDLSFSESFSEEAPPLPESLSESALDLSSLDLSPLEFDDRPDEASIEALSTDSQQIELESQLKSLWSEDPPASDDLLDDFSLDTSEPISESEFQDLFAEDSPETIAPEPANLSSIDDLFTETGFEAGLESAPESMLSGSSAIDDLFAEESAATTMDDLFAEEPPAAADDLFAETPSTPEIDDLFASEPQSEADPLTADFFTAQSEESLPGESLESLPAETSAERSLEEPLFGESLFGESEMSAIGESSPTDLFGNPLAEESDHASPDAFQSFFGESDSAESETSEESALFDGEMFGGEGFTNAPSSNFVAEESLETPIDFFDEELDTEESLDSEDLSDLFGAPQVAEVSGETTLQDLGESDPSSQPDLELSALESEPAELDSWSDFSLEDLSSTEESGIEESADPESRVAEVPDETTLQDLGESDPLSQPDLELSALESEPAGLDSWSDFSLEDLSSIEESGTEESVHLESADPESVDPESAQSDSFMGELPDDFFAEAVAPEAVAPEAVAPEAVAPGSTSEMESIASSDFVQTAPDQTISDDLFPEELQGLNEAPIEYVFGAESTEPEPSTEAALETSPDVEPESRGNWLAGLVGLGAGAVAATSIAGSSRSEEIPKETPEAIPQEARSIDLDPYPNQDPNQHPSQQELEAQIDDLWAEQTEEPTFELEEEPITSSEPLSDLSFDWETPTSETPTSETPTSEAPSSESLADLSFDWETPASEAPSSSAELMDDSLVDLFGDEPIAAEPDSMDDSLVDLFGDEPIAAEPIADQSLFDEPLLRLDETLEAPPTGELMLDGDLPAIEEIPMESADLDEAFLAEMAEQPTLPPSDDWTDELSIGNEPLPTEEIPMEAADLDETFLAEMAEQPTLPPSDDWTDELLLSGEPSPTEALTELADSSEESIDLSSLDSSDLSSDLNGSDLSELDLSDLSSSDLGLSDLDASDLDVSDLGLSETSVDPANPVEGLIPANELLLDLDEASPTDSATDSLTDDFFADNFTDDLTTDDLTTDELITDDLTDDLADESASLEIAGPEPDAEPIYLGSSDTELSDTGLSEAALMADLPPELIDETPDEPIANLLSDPVQDDLGIDFLGEDPTIAASLPPVEALTDDDFEAELAGLTLEDLPESDSLESDWLEAPSRSTLFEADEADVQPIDRSPDPNAVEPDLDLSIDFLDSPTTRRNQSFADEDESFDLPVDLLNQFDEPDPSYEPQFQADEGAIDFLDLEPDTELPDDLSVSMEASPTHSESWFADEAADEADIDFLAESPAVGSDDPDDFGSTPVIDSFGDSFGTSGNWLTDSSADDSVDSSADSSVNSPVDSSVDSSFNSPVDSPDQLEDEEVDNPAWGLDPNAFTEEDAPIAETNGWETDSWTSDVTLSDSSEGVKSNGMSEAAVVAAGLVGVGAVGAGAARKPDNVASGTIGNGRDYAPPARAIDSTGSPWLYTLVLLSVSGLIAGLLGYSLWSEVVSPSSPPVPAPTVPKASSSTGELPVEGVQAARVQAVDGAAS